MLVLLLPFRRRKVNEAPNKWSHIRSHLFLRMRVTRMCGFVIAPPKNSHTIFVSCAASREQLELWEKMFFSMSSKCLFIYKRFEIRVVGNSGGAYYFSARVSMCVPVSCACESFDVRGLIGCVQCRQRSSLNNSDMVEFVSSSIFDFIDTIFATDIQKINVLVLLLHCIKKEIENSLWL